MNIHFHKNDLPDHVSFVKKDFKGAIAIDTEAMGLRTERDRLCLVQLSAGDGDCHLVQIPKVAGSLGGSKIHTAPNLKTVFENQNIIKIFHYGRFDIAAIKHYLGITVTPVFCTKIASKLVRTYTDRHGLKDLCKSFLNVELSKEEQTSDWGAERLSQDQLKYAAQDVLYLHTLKEKLEALLVREGRMEIAQKCFEFLPTLAEMDHLGYTGETILCH